MSKTPISPLRTRMIEDMTIRGFGDKTQSDYIRSVKNLAAFLGRSPDTATPEDIRRFQLNLRQDGASATKMNATVSALRFFFKVTLGRADIERWTQFVREPCKLPVILSPEEVGRIIDCAPGPGLKYKAAFDDRRVIIGIIHVLKSGGRWADAPEVYGPRKTLYNRFVRCAAKGVWIDIFHALSAAGGPLAQVLIDSSAVKAHRCASGGKGGSAPKRSGARAAAEQPRSTL